MGLWSKTPRSPYASLHSIWLNWKIPSSRKLKPCSIHSAPSGCCKSGYVTANGTRMYVIYMQKHSRMERFHWKLSCPIGPPTWIEQEFWQRSVHRPSHAMHLIRWEVGILFTFQSYCTQEYNGLFPGEDTMLLHLWTIGSRCVLSKLPQVPSHGKASSAGLWGPPVAPQLPPHTSGDHRSSFRWPPTPGGSSR